MEAESNFRSSEGLDQIQSNFLHIHIQYILEDIQFVLNESIQYVQCCAVDLFIIHFGQFYYTCAVSLIAINAVFNAKRYTIFWCLHYQPEGWNRNVINFKEAQTLLSPLPKLTTNRDRMLYFLVWFLSNTASLPIAGSILPLLAGQVSAKAASMWGLPTYS